MSRESISRPEVFHKRTSSILIFDESDQNTPKLLLQKKPNGISLVTTSVENNQNYSAAASDMVSRLLGNTTSANLRELQREKYLLRLFSTSITGQYDHLPDSYSWYSKNEIQKLADRADQHRNGLIQNDAWLQDPGLDSQTYAFLQQTGILNDPNQEQRGKIPDFLYGRTPITGRYYGPEYEHTQAASKALERIGIKAYPKPDAPSITISSRDGDTFSFLGGDQLVIAPYQAQLGFFREMRRSHDIPMANKFIYVAIKDGYLGRTASIEVAYAMALGKRLIFSENPTRFSPELPTEIVSLINVNQAKYPHLDINEIQNHLPDALKQSIQDPIVSDEQRALVFSSILELIKDLGDKFGRRI